MYVKLFRDILISTIWMEEDHVVRVWLTLLLLSNKEGFVECPVPGIAQQARVTLDEAISAIDRLESPDPYSRTAKEGGARIVRVTEEKTLWHITNREMYSALRSEDQKREYQKEYMREYRERKKKELTSEEKLYGLAQGEGKGDGEGDGCNVSSEDTLSAPEPADLPKKRSRSRFKPPTVAEVEDYRQEKNLILDAAKFVDHYTSNGWMVGKNKMKDWKSTVRNWARRENELRSNPVKSGSYTGMTSDF